jgi:hypothetical protein
MSFNAQYLSEARILENKWAKTKILEGIKDRNVRSATAVLMENQRLMNEAMTDTGDIAQFKRISIPLVRRIYPQLISNKIVSRSAAARPDRLGVLPAVPLLVQQGRHAWCDLQGGYPSTTPRRCSSSPRGDAAWKDLLHPPVRPEREQLDHPGGTSILAVYAPLEHTPILAGTLTGTVYDGSTAIQTFVVSRLVPSPSPTSVP